MAVACEVDNCGVLAVGRCTSCNRAFCLSHMASTSTDMCTVCQSERNTAHFRAQWDPVKELQRAPAALRAAGVPSVPVHASRVGFIHDRKGRLKGVETIVDPTAMEGWLLGQYHWVALGEPNRAVHALTALVADLREVSNQLGLVRVEKEGSRYLIVGSGVFFGTTPPTISDVVTATPFSVRGASAAVAIVRQLLDTHGQRRQP